LTRPAPAANRGAMLTWTRIFDDGFTHTIGAVERAHGAEGPQDLYRFQIGPQHAAPDGSAARGLLMTFIDTALWAVVLTQTHARLSPPAGEGAATVSLNTDFLTPARIGETVFARGHVTRKTRTIAFASGELFVEREGREVPVLSAIGVWKILGA
jgi:acyl-coenzyme A thioesterase PaaI-like protein